jgi:DNA-binding SARP family transcriptional activator
VDRPPAARVTLLDGFRLEVPGRHRRSAGEELPRGVQRLVAHLCLSHRPTRTATAGQLWPDVPEDHAHGSLRSALWRLNKAAPGVIEVSGSALRLAEGVRVDVWELDDWAQRAISPPGCADDVAVPDTALLGDLLPGWYDDWVLLERERLRQLRMQALEAVADSPSAADTARPWRPPMPRSAPTRCGRAPTGRSSGSTWPRGTWPRPCGPTSSSGRWWRTSSACPRPSR